MPPTVLQAQPTECGIACLAMMLAHHGRFEALEDVRGVVGASRDGTTAAQLARAARHYGFEVDVRSREPDDLPAMALPVIVHLRFLHFVVLEAIDDHRVVLNDPACGRWEFPRSRFDVDHTGVVLSLTPGGGFERGGRPERPLRGAVRRTLAHWPLVLVMLAAWGLAAAAAVGFAREAGGGVEAWLAGSRPVSSLRALGLGLLAVTAGVLAELAHVHLGRRLVRASTAPFVRHALRLPGSFHAYRVPSSLQEIAASTERSARLQASLTGGATRAAMALAVLLPTLLAADGVLATVLFALLLAVGVAQLAGVRHELLLARRVGFEGSASFLASSRSLLNMIAVKTNGHDDELLRNRAGGAARRLDGEQRVAERRLPVVLASQAVVLAVPLLALTALALGRFTGGEAVTFLVLGLALSLGLAGWADGLRELDALRHALPRQDEVRSIEPLSQAALPTVVAEGKPGELVATRLVFGFDRHRAPIIDGVSLRVRRGRQLGITGPSGGGKSTLAGLLVGLHEPWSGTVERNGSRTAWVDSSTFLFPGTVRENLVAWREGLCDDDLERALRDAELADLIAARGGLDAEVEACGLNFSAGQRQRLELARAFAGEPELLVLDEAMDALDDATQEAIRASCRRHGRTLVVISHRASALALCDEVLHVVQGELVAERRSA